jgi:L,D-peptidoglycan transpeptidase YkuD (ErfK/YbiS/YcfS/YnhG family)
MHGHVGFRGVAAPGTKREGDRRTPGGTFTLSLGFGTRADPGGTWFPWRRATRDDVWVDDSGSEHYNTWQQLPSNGRWDSAERLYQPLDYAYAQVVDYNTARTPGRGSAIFLHVDDGNPTLGCVTVPRSQLLRLFRWERPGVRIVIR